MGANSHIEWTDHSFNPWIGCQRVSPGCVHCYAENRDNRFTGGSNWGPKATRTVTSPGNWRKPIAWNRDAHATYGRNARVFCASLADVFEDREDLVAPRGRLFALIQSTPALNWLLLTKRPENMVRLAADLGWDGDWPANVWAGCTVEDQERADERIPELLQVPARVRFLSCEPLLGAADLSRYLGWLWECPECGYDTGEAKGETVPRSRSFAYCGLCAGDTGRDVQVNLRGPGIHWVICGGESGHGARPMHPDWARSLREQCQAAGVAFHFKQWGEFCPTANNEGGGPFLRLMNGETWATGRRTHRFGEGYFAEPLGKHRSGRLLDGRTWDEFPPAAEVAR